MNRMPHEAHSWEASAGMTGHHGRGLRTNYVRPLFSTVSYPDSPYLTPYRRKHTHPPGLSQRDSVYHKHYCVCFVARGALGSAKSTARGTDNPRYLHFPSYRYNSHLLPWAATASMLSAMSQMRSACGARFSPSPSCPPPAQQRYEQSMASSLYTW